MSGIATTGARVGYLGTLGRLGALYWHSKTGHLRTMRLFVRRAGPGLYFNRVPSLPATDDGSARPLAEDLNTGSGGSEDITWDADTEPGTAGAGRAPEASASDGGPKHVRCCRG